MIFLICKCCTLPYCHFYCWSAPECRCDFRVGSSNTSKSFLGAMTKRIGIAQRIVTSLLTDAWRVRISLYDCDSHCKVRDLNEFFAHKQTKRYNFSVGHSCFYLMYPHSPIQWAQPLTMHHVLCVHFKWFLLSSFVDYGSSKCCLLVKYIDCETKFTKDQHHTYL